ncbi:MAG: hypothetical protein P1P65_04990 [Treponema sp.]
MKLYKRAALLMLTAVCIFPLHAFNSGLRLGLRANLTGSLTRPKISKADMAYLGGNGMKGMLGYVTTGEADLTYLFDSIKYFRCQDNEVFGGLGWSFALGLGQGFSGQVSGAYNETIHKQVNVFCRVHMTPVLTFGSGIRSYFLRNRLALGGTVGIRMPLDPQPIYEMYTNLTPKEVDQIKDATNTDGAPIDFGNETGTLQITEDQMRKINPVGYMFKGVIEYNQPFITNMEIVLGMFLSYTIYKPKYVTMPPKLIHAAEKQGAKNVTGTPINSFYMNSLDFGITVGLNFKV